MTALTFQHPQQNWGFTLRSVTSREGNFDQCCCFVLLDTWWIFITLMKGEKVEWEEGGTICLFLWDKNVPKDRTSGKPQAFVFWTNGSNQSRQAFKKKGFSQICLANNTLRRTYLYWGQGPSAKITLNFLSWSFHLSNTFVPKWETFLRDLNYINIFFNKTWRF